MAILTTLGLLESKRPVERPIKSVSSWRRSGDTEREREATEDEVSSTEDWADMADSATVRLCAGLKLIFTNRASPGTETERELQVVEHMITWRLCRCALVPGENNVYEIIVRQAAGKRTCNPDLLFICCT